jgi:hypothetical protein
MPDGKAFEMPSGVEHRAELTIPLTMEVQGSGAVFTLDSTDQNMRAALTHVLSDRYGDRLHSDSHTRPFGDAPKRHDIQMIIEPGTPEVTDDVLDQVLNEVRILIKRMGGGRKTQSDIQEAA